MTISGEKIKIFYLILIYLIISSISFPQTNLIDSDKGKLVFKPTFHSIQLEATIFFFEYEIGGQFDFDFFVQDEKICFGTRMSIEHYYSGSPGGTILGSPFANYNLYARFSNRLGILSISLLSGVTYYTTSEPGYLPDKFLFRAGYEIKLTENFIGLVLKGSTSFIDKSSFIGIGISIGYNHN